MKRLNHDQMDQVSGAGLLGDLLGGVGNTVDGVLTVVLAGVALTLATLIGTLQGARR